MAFTVRPDTPTSGSDDDFRHGLAGRDGQHAEDTDDNEQAQSAPKRKTTGYESRVEQILAENPSMQIVISEAGKSLESGGRYIVYTIRTGVSMVFFSQLNFGADFAFRTSKCAADILSLRLCEMP